MLDIDNRKRNGNEIKRFAAFVLGVDVNLLKFNKWRNGNTSVEQMPDAQFEQLRQFLIPEAPHPRQSALEELFASKYKPALEMILQTGCRPSEALYATNFRKLWTQKGKNKVFTLPAALSKTGFEQQWTFDAAGSARLAEELWKSASDEDPCDELHDESAFRLRYRGLYNYFVRVQQALGLQD